jgi:SAM-dependent methyltransferase
LSRAVVTSALLGCVRRLRRLLKIFAARMKIIFGRIRNRLLRPKAHNLQDWFSLIYSRNMFRGRESRSGEGSNLVQTAEIRRVLPGFLQELHVQSVLDAPCGDLFWMRETPLGVEKYIGVDIVEELVEKNRQELGDETHEFLCRNLARDELPRVDLIFCRDCLVHLTYADVNRVLSNFKRSGSRYLLTTTFPGRDRNIDLVGRNVWRTLNLQAAPFNFPPPLELIDEKCTEGDGGYADKSLGLWRLSDIEVT